MNSRLFGDDAALLRVMPRQDTRLARLPLRPTRCLSENFASKGLTHLLEDGYDIWTIQELEPSNGAGLCGIRINRKHASND
jgi:hypothetical protein